MRPEGLADAHWDPKSGVKLAELIADHGKHAAFRADADARAAKAPESADKYEVRLPEDFETPEGFKFEPDMDDPRLAQFRAFAHERGFTQDDFSAILAIDAQQRLAVHQADKAFAEDQTKQLGEKAAQRREAAARFLDASADFGKEAKAALKDLMVFAGGVMAVEQIMAMKAGPTTVRTGGEGAVTGKDISGMTWAEKAAIAGKRAAALAGVKTA